MTRAQEVIDYIAWRETEQRCKDIYDIRYVIDRSTVERHGRGASAVRGFIRNWDTRLIDRAEIEGAVDSSCQYCQRYIIPRLIAGEQVMYPSHKNIGCESGGRPHCTCDGCF